MLTPLQELRAEVMAGGAVWRRHWRAQDRRTRRAVRAAAYLGRPVSDRDLWALVVGCSASLTCCSFGPFRRVGNKLGNKSLPTAAGSRLPTPDLLGPVLRVVLTAATTGLRQSELLGLRWRDVDRGAQRIRVRNAWLRAEHSAEGKSELSTRRSVPMTDRLVGELDRWSRTQYGGERDLVFAHPQSGRPLDRTKVTRRFQGGLRGRRRAAHPLPRPTPHLRHPRGSVRPAAFVADEGRLPPAVRAPD